MESKPAKEKNPKKVILIILLVSFLLILCCCGGYIALLFFGGDIAASEATIIQEDNLIPLCRNYNTLNEGNMSTYFHSEYGESSTVTKEFLSEIFPMEYDCNDLYTDGFIDLITKGQSVEVYTGIDGREATVMVETVEGKIFTVILLDDEGGWKIYQMSKSDYL